MKLGIDGKIAIVTGGTANIGRSVALELADNGVKVVIVGRDAKAGAKVVELAKERGANDARFVAADLLDPHAPAAILDEAEALGPIDILINAVGGNVAQGFFVESDPEDWQGDVDLNFTTMLRMTRAVLPGMIERKAGSIVNIGSTAGMVGDYMLAVYSAMKGAVHSFSAVLAKEVGQHGVRVNAVAPYATIAKDPDAFSSGSRFNPETGLFAQGQPEMSDYDRSMRQRRTVLDRPFAEPEEVAALVAFLASERASYITGKCWPVDGGALL